MVYQNISLIGEKSVRVKIKIAFNGFFRINKFHIALKECYETEYWLELLENSKIVEDVEAVKDLHNQCGSIRRLLIASINTAKNNDEKNK